MRNLTSWIGVVSRKKQKTHTKKKSPKSQQIIKQKLSLTSLSISVLALVWLFELGFFHHRNPTLTRIVGKGCWWGWRCWKNHRSGSSAQFCSGNMDVSENSGTPKWMVKIMETPIKMDDLGVPPFWETPIWVHMKHHETNLNKSVRMRDSFILWCCRWQSNQSINDEDNRPINKHPYNSMDAHLLYIFHHPFIPQVH